MTQFSRRFCTVAASNTPPTQLRLPTRKKAIGPVANVSFENKNDELVSSQTVPATPK